VNLLSQRPDVGEFRKRYPWMMLVVLALMGTLIGKLVHLQIIKHEENSEIARENIVHRTVLATSRGLVRDRNGVVLAGSRESWNVYVVPARLDLDKTWPALADYLGLGPVERGKIELRLRQVRADDLAALKKNHKYHIREVIVRDDIGRDVVGVLETRKEELPAVSWVSVPMRYYPNKELAFHLLGYVNEVTKEDLDAAPEGSNLQAGDRIGRSGIEKTWESYLRGQRGWRKTILDAKGNRRTAKEDLAHLDEPREQPPIPGRDVRLTIDIDLVQAAKRAFAGHLSGGVVALEAKTGRILALYSKPSVDGNGFVSGLSTKQAEEILQNPLRPLIDKTMFDAFFPGSTMKPFTALAALRTHAISLSSLYTCEHVFTYGKTRFKCEGLHGTTNLHDAIVHSCNIYFYQVGRDAGIDAIAAMNQEFGFGMRSGIGIQEVPGLVPTQAWYTQHYGGNYHKGFALNAAIGQGNTKVTPLQLALAYAALGNGGTLWAPQLVRSIETPVIDGQGGGVEIDFAPRVRRKITLAPNDLRYVLDAMHGVVNEEGGTAFRERIPGLDVAGKTGTAQVSKVGPNSGIDPHSLWYFNRDHAWFAGFAPFDDPEIAIVAFVEHGGGGGRNAAPIAFRVMQEYFQKLKPAREGPGGGAGKPSVASSKKDKDGKPR
jgi:penicillin-binding protein 2